MKILKNLLAISTISFSAYSNAQQCPVPPTAIDVSIQESHEYDQKSQEYIYTYKVANGPRAKVDMFIFQIESPQDVQAVSLPFNWRKEFDSAVGKYPSYVTLTNSFNDIKPGSKPYIFKIKSKLPPGLTRYYAEGMPNDQLKAVTFNNDNEADPDCPGFYINTETTLERRITGITIGPAPTANVEVKLKMKVKKDKSPRGRDDESDEPEISAVDKGKVEVIMYGAKNLDLGLVDLNSIQFGPAKAKPLSSKIVAGGSHFNGWRKDPVDKNKIILMEFKIEDLLIRCDLDKALFLSAKAGAKNILGAVPMKPVLCDPQTWKQMGTERKWPKRSNVH